VSGVGNKIRLLITDFDGTIKPRLGPVAAEDNQALKAMGQGGLVRVVATGRSLVSFLRDWTPEIELDYLIYSSGLALCRWTPTGPGEHLFVKAFSPEERKLAVEIALALGFGFIAFKAPPQSHSFYYLDPSRGPRSPGFQARLDQFPFDAEPWPGAIPGDSLSQVLVMAPATEFPALSDRVAAQAPSLSVTRSASPYEDERVWLEIFPGQVTKGAAAQALADLLGFQPAEAAAVGNDFNDESLLAWAGRAFAVAEAPQELLERFEPLKPTGVLAQVWRAIA
jgi:hydroxymethylpyrimidine pyrophosphatase-like HAD family hydrolase